MELTTILFIIYCVIMGGFIVYMIASIIRDASKRRARRAKYTQENLVKLIKMLGFGVREYSDGDLFVSTFGEGANRNEQPIKSAALDNTENVLAQVEARLYALEDFLKIEYVEEQIKNEAGYRKISPEKKEGK